MTREEYEEKYGVKIPTPGLAEPSTSTEPQEDEVGFFGEAGQDIAQTASGIGEASRRTGADIQQITQTKATLPEKVGQIGGRILGGASDIFGEVVKGGAKLALTRGGEERVRGGISKVAEPVAESEFVQDLIARYEGLSEENKDTVDAMLGVGKFVTDLAGLKVAQVGIKGAKPALETAATTAIKGVREGAEATAKVAGKTIGKKLDDVAVRNALELTEPVLLKKGAIGGFTQAGKPGGFTTKGPFGKIVREPTKFDREVAEAAAPFVKKLRNPVRNNESLNREIARFANDEVTPFLKGSTAKISKKNVEKALNDIEIPPVFKTDAVMERSYETVRKMMLKRLDEADETAEGMWKARIKFDKDVADQ